MGRLRVDHEGSVQPDDAPLPGLRRRLRTPPLRLFLSITGIVSARQLFAATPYAILSVFIVGAMLTPPDPVSQIFLAVPLIILYLLGVGVAWIFDPERRAAKGAGNAVATRDD